MEQENSLFGLRVDPENSNYMLETAKWAKFLGIIGIIGCILMLLLGIGLASFGGAALSTAYGSPVMGAGVMVSQIGVIIVAALLYFMPSLYIYRFATRMQIAHRANDQVQFNSALANLKAAFKFIGIMTIIVLALYAILIIFVVIGAGMAASF